LFIFHRNFCQWVYFFHTIVSSTFWQ
jgi:hypothetical protein